MDEKKKRMCTAAVVAAIAAILLGMWACTSGSTRTYAAGSHGSSVGSAASTSAAETANGSASGSSAEPASQEDQGATEADADARKTGSSSGETQAVAEAEAPATGQSATSSSTSTAQQQKPSAAPKSGSNTASTASQPSRTWVEEQGHWEPTYDDVWVIDSAAWDEQVPDYDYYAFSDGFNTTSDAEALAHQKATGASYSVQQHYKTVHHDEAGHWEHRQTGSKWVVDVPAHWE